MEYAGRSDLFEGLSIWQDEKYREIQGTYPVLSLSFARVKEKSYDAAREKICEILRELYIEHIFLKDSELLTDADRAYYDRILSMNVSDSDVTSDKYADAFGFTEQEAFAALEERGLGTEREKVQKWYDGYVFGSHRDIYNPWSILNYIDKEKFSTYWANTSSNSLMGKLIRDGSSDMKGRFEGF